MYATGVSEAILEDFAEGCAKDFHNDEVHYLKAVDEESGTIAAYAKWYIYKQERSREEWDQDHSYEGTLEGVNYDAINDFLGGIRESRRKIAKGSRHACRFSIL